MKATSLLTIFLGLLPVYAHALPAANHRSPLSANKTLVRDFYDLAFNQHKPKEAALKYLSEEYVQHNPHVGTGRQAFIDAFAGEKDDTSKAEFKRTLAEDDLVMLHSFKTEKPGDRGVAGVDLFRVKNGKITEHWDVNQKIPAESKNTNTMF
jgi:predicted SnoaL-like aldol condensation-catalyzing enzyme